MLEVLSVELMHVHQGLVLAGEMEAFKSLQVVKSTLDVVFSFATLLYIARAKISVVIELAHVL